jgi:hypothetical protein
LSLNIFRKRNTNYRENMNSKKKHRGGIAEETGGRCYTEGVREIEKSC